MMPTDDHGTDGAFDRVLRLGHKTKAVPAIFIHAGAGFHSHQNEHVHLEACVSYLLPSLYPPPPVADKAFPGPPRWA